MGDWVGVYLDFYQDGAGDEPLVDGRTAHILDTDWADRPTKAGSALFFVFDSRYHLLDPDEAAEQWLSRTRDTWGLLSQWKLCRDCHAAGMGATRKDHLHQLSTAFPPFQRLKPDENCDFCPLLRHTGPCFLEEKIARRLQRTSHSDNSHLDITCKLDAFMPILRSPTSMTISLSLAPPGAEELVTGNLGDEALDGLEGFSIYVTFEKGGSQHSRSLDLSPGPTLKESKPTQNRPYTSRTRVGSLPCSSRFGPQESR
ncbi:hypothetical protein B0T18DRAFT_239241 [Schizothecium vesticola]|uniref:Uncharacterized protein n=1 Tax=Schizothecium vesticola TaxID=314040 RepID=A0AA40BPV0_9PEZI|nr:hypothetical protein B0T18DRAFT_239241 [Schizothecium vesticola]